MKKTILISFFFLAGYYLSAQTALEYIYEYDASGNRTCRYVVELPSHVPDTVSANENIENDIYYINDIGNINVRVYPNPTMGMLFIKITNYENFHSGELFLYNIDGRLLERISVNSSDIEINLSNHTQGIYLLKLQINDFHQEWKIIRSN